MLPVIVPPAQGQKAPAQVDVVAGIVREVGVVRCIALDPKLAPAWLHLRQPSLLESRTHPRSVCQTRPGPHRCGRADFAGLALNLEVS